MPGEHHCDDFGDFGDHVVVIIILRLVTTPVPGEHHCDDNCDGDHDHDYYGDYHKDSCHHPCDRWAQLFMIMIIVVI